MKFHPRLAQKHSSSVLRMPDSKRDEYHGRKVIREISTWKRVRSLPTGILIPKINPFFRPSSHRDFRGERAHWSRFHNKRFVVIRMRVQIFVSFIFVAMRSIIPSLLRRLVISKPGKWLLSEIRIPLRHRQGLPHSLHSVPPSISD